MSEEEDHLFTIKDRDFKECLDERLVAELLLDGASVVSDIIYKGLTENPGYRLPENLREALLGSEFKRLFVGAYQQTHAGSGELAFSMPFQMRQNVGYGFQGEIIEMGPKATFRGEFNPGSGVTFDKQYEGRSHIITYEGEFDSKLGLYLGGWKINTEERGNLEPDGKFFLREL
jgi:hypothetical protein